MSPSQKLPTHHILLADDDKDDCLLFKDALDDLPLTTQLSMVRNGEQLMLWLNTKEELPHVLFLDLNMPRKNGFECLSEIKQDEKLRSLPVIIISTSFEPDIVKLLYKQGAQHYICKPNAYEQLVKLVHLAITVTSPGNLSQPTEEEFVLSPESCYNESPVSKSNKMKF
jgi:CheY-like chemotaxis protein